MDIELGGLIAILIPIAAIQIGLALFALYDLTRPGRQVKIVSKGVWALIVIFVNIFGPILYFLVGREDA